MTKLSHRAWGLDTLPDGEWLQYAQCKPDDAPLFDVFGHKGVGEQTLTEQNQQAVNICRRCPVRAECLQDAQDHPTDWWFILGGEVVHRGQVIPSRPAKSRGPRMRMVTSPAEPAPEPDTEPADFADAVADLLGLGWSVGRVAEALGIGVTAVRQHAQQQAVP
jgi:Transcription factor WhiB.